MHFKKVILFIIGIAVMLMARAQQRDPGTIYYHISEKDGLTDNLVTCFYQDNRGVIWMGTAYGLNSFDGSVINTWRSENGLPNNRVNSIAGDDRHRLWFATQTGLATMDAATNKILSWHYAGGDYMTALICAGDSIWIGTLDGLLLFNSRTKTFEQFKNNAHKSGDYNFINDNTVISLLLDSKGRLWLATDDGLWLFDRRTKTFTQYDNEQNDPFFDHAITSVKEDHSGNIWAGSYTKGLKQIITETHSVRNFNQVKNASTHVAAIAEQLTAPGQYSLWMGGRLNEFKPATGQFIDHDLSGVTGSPSSDVQALYVSRDNLLWMSTEKGVYILDPERQLFKHYFISGQNIITDQAAALYVQDSYLWIGGQKKYLFAQVDDNLNMVHDHSAAIRQLKGDFLNPALSVMSITPRRADELWLSTSAGVVRFNVRTNKADVISNGITDATGHRQQFITNTFIVRSNVYCFPWRRGIWKYDTISKKFDQLIGTLPDEQGRPKNLNILDAVYDNDHQLWFADLDYGIVKYAGGVFKRVVNNVITPHSKPTRLFYQKGVLWCVNNTDIISIGTKTGHLRNWPIPTGLNKVVYDCLLEGDNLWICTRDGLVLFNIIDHSFTSYTEADGIIDNQMDGELRKLFSGEILYVGDNFITRFSSGQLLHGRKNKPVLLTSVVADDDKQLGINSAHLIIQPGTKKLSFSWALPNYSNPFQNRYYCKLEKVDKRWNYIGNKGQIDYNSLPAGRYKFYYRAVSSDGLTSAENNIVFIVEPRFWNSWWFRALCLAVAAALVWLMLRSVQRREQKKAAMQLQLSELELKALRAQMNPHFIFNALNSIQECIVTNNTGAAHDYLSHFSRLVRLILENSEKQFIRLDEEIRTLSLYLSLEKLRFDDSFNYCINVPAQLDTSFINIPTMILQPFIENALWHGLMHRPGSKVLTVSFSQRHNELVCTIADNGIGRKKAGELNMKKNMGKSSMGIKITLERLHLLETNADIVVDDLEDADGNASGTLVTITLPLQF